MSVDCPLVPRTNSEASSESEPVDTSTLDSQAFLEVLGGDVEVLKVLVEIFREDYPRLLAEMREALRLGDGGALSRAAHALKGTVGNFRAHAAYGAARHVELAAREGDLISAAAAFPVLEEAMRRVEPALTEMLRAAA